ncbi:MAG: hypothetical protein ACREIT_02015 [Tepidisphaeraceae bacterium]
MSVDAQIDILNAITAPGFNDLDPVVAKRVLAMKFNAGQKARMHALGTMARAGTLSREEQAELDYYLVVSQLLTLLHSKARMALRREGDRPPRRRSA